MDQHLGVRLPQVGNHRHQIGFEIRLILPVVPSTRIAVVGAEHDHRQIGGELERVPVDRLPHQCGAAFPHQRVPAEREGLHLEPLTQQAPENRRIAVRGLRFGMGTR